MPSQLGVWGLSSQAMMAYVVAGQSADNRAQGGQRSACQAYGYLPQSLLTAIDAQQLAQRLLHKTAQKQRLVYFRVIGRQFYAGDTIVLTDHGFSVPVAGSYRVLRVEFTPGKEFSEQLIVLQPQAVTYQPYLGDVVEIQATQAENYYIGMPDKSHDLREPSPHQSKPKAADVPVNPIMDAYGYYYAYRNICCLKSANPYKALWRTLVPRLLWCNAVDCTGRSAPQKFSAWHATYSSGDRVWAEKLYACRQAMCILAADQPTATTAADASDAVALSTNSMECNWAWQSKKLQGMLWQQSAASMTLFTPQQANCLQASCAADTQKHVDNKTAASNLNLYSAKQTIDCQAKQNIFLQARRHINFRQERLQVNAPAGINLKSSKGQLQVQSTAGIIFNAKTINCYAHSALHLHSENNLTTSISNQLNISAQQLVIKAPASLCCGEDITLACSGAGSISLQVGSSLLRISSGLITIFSSNICVAAASAYVGKVQIIPSPISPLGLCRLERFIIATQVKKSSTSLECAGLAWCQPTYAINQIAEARFQAWFTQAGSAQNISLQVELYLVCRLGQRPSAKWRELQSLQQLSLEVGGHTPIYNLKFRLVSLDWSKILCGLKLKQAQLNNLGLVFKLRHAQQEWVVSTVASLLWPVEFALRIYQAGRSWLYIHKWRLKAYRYEYQAYFLLDTLYLLYQKDFNHLQAIFLDYGALVVQATIYSDAHHHHRISEAASDKFKPVGLELISPSTGGKLQHPDAFYKFKIDAKYNKYLRDRGRFKSDVHALAPPIVLDLVAAEHVKANDCFTPMQIEQLRNSGGKVTLFVHGFDVSPGRFSEYLQAAASEDATDIDLIASGVNKSLFTDDLDSICGIDKTISVSKTALHKYLQHEPGFVLDSQSDMARVGHPKFNLENPGSAAGAHADLQRLEYYLNKAAGFRGDDYRRYQRLVLVLWPSCPFAQIDYGDSMTKAQIYGQRLAAALAELKAQQFDVSVIAHSLGCGVACVAADYLFKKYNLHIERLVLWQPALPNSVLSVPQPVTARRPHSSLVNTYLRAPYPWYLPYLWHGVKKITVLFSRYDNILGPIDFAGTSMQMQKKIMQQKPLFPERMSADLLQSTPIACVYKLGAWLGVPGHILLFSKHQDRIYQYLRASLLHKSGPLELPGSFAEYVTRFRQQHYNASSQWYNSALIALLLQQAGFIDRVPEAVIAGSWWWWSKHQHAGWLDMLRNSVYAVWSLYELVKTYLGRPLTPALGYTGPDWRDASLRKLQHSGRLEVIDESAYLWQHSGIYQPSTAMQAHIYTQIVSQLPGFLHYYAQ